MKNNNPHYLKTNDMAKLIGYSGDYLLQNRGMHFIEGIHFFPKHKRIDWKVQKMFEWVENQNLSSEARKILDFVS